MTTLISSFYRRSLSLASRNYKAISAVHGLVVSLACLIALAGCNSSDSIKHADSNKANVRAARQAQKSTENTRQASSNEQSITVSDTTPPHGKDGVNINAITQPLSLAPKSSDIQHKAKTTDTTTTQLDKPKVTEDHSLKAPSITLPHPTKTDPSSVIQLCKEIGDKLGSVSTKDCLTSKLTDSGGRSLQNRSLALSNFLPVDGVESLGRVLLIGGIHGDEYSAVSIVFKWIQTLRRNHSGVFQWRIAPLSNPDGLLRSKSQRQNHAGVDLNRNFPTPNWEKESKHYWEKRTYKNPRRYPGPKAASEPETQWLIQQIEEFQPDAIVAVHAPHSLVDYDGPQTPPEKLGSLQLLRLGIYPGSLGNYAGINRNIPVVTIELPSAGIMPSNKEVKRMWLDLVKWLKTEVPKQRLAKTP